VPSQDTAGDIRDLTPTLQNEYSQACSAYREFLLGNRADESGEELYYRYYTFGIENAEFTIVDINHDGIPELHFRARHYTIYSYRNGVIFEVASFQQHTELLNNLAIYSDYWGRNQITAASRYYVEFGENLQPRFSLYFGHDDETGVYRIAYNQETPIDVSKQEFDEITLSIRSLTSDIGNYDIIPWVNYGEWLSENIGEYSQLEGVGLPR